MMNKTLGKTLTILGCGVFLAGGLVGSAAILSRFMVKIQKENTISVKGVAERQVIADLAAFRCTVSVKSEKLADGYRKLNADFEKLLERLRLAGFSSDELVDDAMSHVTINKIVDGKDTGEFSHYLFYRSIQVRSRKVSKIQEESLRLHALLTEGIAIEVSSPSYFITNPEQYKLDLITAATAAAVNRANTIARECGGKVGKLITARQGVIQITRPASNDTSDYGVYDTTSPDKVIRIVVSLDVEII